MDDLFQFQSLQHLIKRRQALYLHFGRLLGFLVEFLLVEKSSMLLRDGTSHFIGTNTYQSGVWDLECDFR